MASYRLLRTSKPATTAMTTGSSKNFVLKPAMSGARWNSSAAAATVVENVNHFPWAPRPMPGSTTELVYTSNPDQHALRGLQTDAPPARRRILNCLMQNEPGVLARVLGVLAARGLNLASLVVCSTEMRDVSRMTIVLIDTDAVVEQARRQLEDIVHVWEVLDLTGAALIQRELLLARIDILGPGHPEKLLEHYRNSMTPSGIGSESVAKNNHRSPTPPTGWLNRHKQENLLQIMQFTQQFGGKVLVTSTDSCVVEVSAEKSRIDSFLKLVTPFGILELARTGLMALPLSSCDDDAEDSRKFTTRMLESTTWRWPTQASAFLSKLTNPTLLHFAM